VEGNDRAVESPAEARRLDGRVVIVTGAGSGLGRSYALALGRLGARVIVNDLGVGVAGEHTATRPADAVVEEILRAGGDAVGDYHDVSDWEGARALVKETVFASGRLDGLVNNAGILRDHPIAEMTEADWDAVLAVNLKGHVAPTHWAVRHWLDQPAAGGRAPRAHVVNTASVAALDGSAGQANYAAAKGAIIALTLTLAEELRGTGIHANAIAPRAWTRMRDALTGRSPRSESADTGFDPWDPDNIAPLVAYLVSADCDLTGEVLYLKGGDLARMKGWRRAEHADLGRRWTLGEIARWTEDPSTFPRDSAAHAGPG